MQAGDSLTDVMRVVSVLWLYKMNWGAASWVALCSYSTPKQTAHNHFLSSLSATRLTTLCSKQPTLFFAVWFLLATVRVNRMTSDTVRGYPIILTGITNQLYFLQCGSCWLLCQ